MAERILFVCTGNVCRSAAAAAIWRGLNGPREADSAGISAFWDQPADPDTSVAAAELGFDLSPHRSKPVHAGLLKPPLLVLCMDDSHLAWVRRIRPDLTQVHLFKPYCEGRERQGSFGGGDDVADPIGHAASIHRRCVNDIHRLLIRLVDRMK